MTNEIDAATMDRLIVCAENPIVGGDIRRALNWIDTLEIQVESMRIVLASVAEKAGLSDKEVTDLLYDVGDKVIKARRGQE